MKGLQSIIQDPDSATEEKAKFIKESAYLHLNDLFTKSDISPVVTDAAVLVKEMVNFVSTDVAAVASLMRLSSHDYYTYNHCVDVAVYSIVLAKKVVGEKKEVLLAAGLGGLLHDIGKRRIALELINKKEPLTAAEWEEMKRHTVYGLELIQDIPAIAPESKSIVLGTTKTLTGLAIQEGCEKTKSLDLPVSFRLQMFSTH